MRKHPPKLYGVDLNLLVAFDALISERSVTRAGARIGRTQPAMSAALRRLRALFDDELFVGSPEGLEPTPRALELAEPLGEALAQIQRTLDFTQRFDPKTSTASFRLAVSDHPALVVLPKLIGHLRENAPGVTLRVTSFTHRDDAVTTLDRGEADVTIGVPATVPPGGRILGRSLFEEPFVCIVRKGHPERHRLDLDTYLSLSHLLISPENERFGVVDVALSKRGLKRRIALTLPQMYAAPPIIIQSNMIATVMAGVVEACGFRDSLHVSKPPLELDAIPFMMLWHRRNEAHPAQRWLRTCIASLFEQSDLSRRLER
jgi:DNA-binding transcriptional LysR family regulator